MRTHASILFLNISPSPQPPLPPSSPLLFDRYPRHLQHTVQLEKTRVCKRVDILRSGYVLSLCLACTVTAINSICTIVAIGSYTITTCAVPATYSICTIVAIGSYTITTCAVAPSFKIHTSADFGLSACAWPVISPLLSSTSWSWSCKNGIMWTKRWFLWIMHMNICVWCIRLLCLNKLQPQTPNSNYKVQVLWGCANSMAAV